MGNYSSSRPSLMEEPWREPSNWYDRLENSIRSEIDHIKPKEKANIVCVGPIGAGKSSFINSILTVANRHKIEYAPVKKGSKSCTVKYMNYKDNIMLENFQWKDCMGIEQGEEDGFNTKDIIAVLKGHVKVGYEFNPRTPISKDDRFYREDPQYKHQAHCVVFVVDGNAIQQHMPRHFLKKIKEMQEEIRRLHIPRVLILTKADLLCKEVYKNNEVMFRSWLVKEAVKTASDIFNIPEASIHPVTNYERTYDMTWKYNIPILLALKHILHYAYQKIEDDLQNSDRDSE